MLKLNSMEIAGFKSFRERVQIKFPQGLTGVVGPNGCGKSNLLDAICWALGEQSASALRGQRMGDLIFNGTRNRRASPMAEVVLRLAGTNGHTGEPLHLTRRLYQSGDSEYLLNGQKVRLKDITERLMGTGIGVRAYSIIHQGKVEEILSSKPEERRILIEEAAGITRYRSKRRSATLKLERTEQDLLRVADILREVERQRNSLKRQASAARRFRTHKRRERFLLRMEFGFRHRELGAALREAESALGVAQASQAEATRATAETEARLERLRVQLEEQSSVLEEQRDAQHRREREIDRLEHTISTSKERLAELDSQIASRRGQVEGLAATIREGEEQIRALQREFDQSETHLQDAREALDKAETEFREARESLQRIEEEEELGREALFAAASAISDCRNAAESATEAARRSRAVAERYRRQAEEIEEELRRATETCASAQFALTAAQETNQAAREALDGARAAIQSKTEEIDEAMRSREESIREESRAESRFALLRKLDEEGERCAGGVRALLEAAREAGIPGFRGLLVDHLQVDPGLEVAVESVLRDRLQWMVVASSESAQTAAAKIRAEEVGGASFLYSAHCAIGDETELSAPAGTQPLLQSVRSEDPTVAAALAEWLKNAFLVTNGTPLSELSERHPGAVFVTSDGACWGPGPVLHQEGAGSEGGLLRLKSEIRESEQALSQANHQRASEEARVTRLQAELDRYRSTLEERTGKVREAERNLLEAEHKLAAANHQRERLDEQHRMQAGEAERAERETEEHEAAAEEALVEAREAEEQKQQEEERLDELKERGSRTENKIGAVEQELRRLREVLADRRETRESARLRLEHAEHRREEAIKAQGTLDRETKDLAERCAMLQTDASEAETQLTEQLQQRELAKDALRQAEEAVNATRLDLQREETEIKVRREQQEGSSRAVSEVEIRLAGLHSDRDHLKRECWNDLGEDILSVAKAPPVEEPEAAEPVRRLQAPQEEEPPTSEEGAESIEAAAQPEERPEEPAEVAAETAEEVTAPLDWDDPSLPEPAAVREELAEVRRKIERIGSVNLVAIDEFEELDQRWTHLKEQQADILEAVESLRQTIRDIDRISRERFVEAFEKVREYFVENFRILFKGGQADIRLEETEDQDILGAGIEIFAQPPGKRLQNIRLLSGGEKALSAIALLFALFRFKPSPFCVLDEVDAPLDDMNLTRFLELVEALEEETQFIIITHNKLSMERADVLYGVTMEEPGCSKLVSVDFREASQHANGNGSAQRAKPRSSSADGKDRALSEDAVAAESLEPGQPFEVAEPSAN